MAVPTPSSSSSSSTQSLAYESVRSSHVASRIENELLTCVICSERYESSGKVPKVLPCVHTFCLECLQQLLRHGRSSSIACPNCRAACSIPEGDARHLPNNLNILDLLDIMQGAAHNASISSTTSIPTPTPTEPSTAQPVTSSSTDGGVNDDLCCCLKHQVIVQYFCLSCEILVCPQCLLEDHRDHSVALANEWLRRCRQEIIERRMLVTAYRTTVGTHMNSLVANMRTVPDTHARLHAEIQAAFGALSNALAARQRVLLETLAAAMTEREEVYKQRVDACVMRGVIITSSIERLSNDATPIPSNNAPPTRGCIQAITNDIALLRDLDIALSSEPENELPDIAFTPDMTQLERHIAQFGALISRPSPQAATVAHSLPPAGTSNTPAPEGQVVVVTPIFRGSGPQPPPMLEWGSPTMATSQASPMFGSEGAAADCTVTIQRRVKKKPKR